MKKRILLVVIVSFMFMGVVSAASLWGTYKGKQIIRLTVNGVPVNVLDAPAVSMDGRTMIPIYLLKEAGIIYTWDQKKQTVNISTQKQQSVPRNTSTGNVSVTTTFTKISSKIESDFDGFNYENIYELSNGQYWKQVDYTYEYEYEYRPDVLIYKEGSYYYMDVENCEKHPRVELIK